MLSHKAKLLASPPSLKPEYLFDPFTDPERLSDQFKQLSEEAHMTSTNVQRALDKMMPIVGYFENGRFKAVATCDVCEKTSEWTANKMPEPSIVSKKFRDRKWQISKRSVTCAVCVKRKKAPRAELMFLERWQEELPGEDRRPRISNTRSRLELRARS